MAIVAGTARYVTHVTYDCVYAMYMILGVTSDAMNDRNPSKRAFKTVTHNYGLFFLSQWVIASGAC